MNFDTPAQRLATRLDTVVEVLLIALLAYLPFAFGGVLPLSHMLILLAAAGMVGCLGLRAAFTDAPLVWSWAYLPLGLFVFLVAVQWVSLPIGLLAFLSPESASTWSEMLSDPGGGELSSASLSLYPHGTLVDLRLLFAWAMIFVVVVNVYRSSQAIERLLVAMALTGFAVTVLSALQLLSDSSAIYWTWETPTGGAAKAGPFVHYGHFSQFVNLSMGCAFALLLVRYKKRFPRQQLAVEDFLKGLRGQEQVFDRFLVGFLILGMVMIALSTSRNGIVSMFVAGAVMAFALQRTRTLLGVGWPMAGLVLAGFIVLLVFGFDPVYERMATLENPDEEYSGRYALFLDAMRQVEAFPWLGSGQGTFEWVFPGYDSTVRPGTAQHAENQYVELLAETGVIGVLLVLAVLVSLVIAWTRSVRGGETSRVVVFGLGFGLVAVAFHATTDFGMRVPAITGLSVVSAALLVAMSSVDRIRAKKLQYLVASVCLLAVAGLLALVPGTFREWRADVQWDRVEEMQELIAPPEFFGETGEFDEMLRSIDLAVEMVPDNLEYRYWAAMHRWHRELSAVDARVVVDRSIPELVVAAKETRDRLLLMRTLNPTHGSMWSSVGQFGVQWIDAKGSSEYKDSARYVQRGMQLAPHNSAIVLAAAQQSLDDGDADTAVRGFQHALKLGHRRGQVLGALFDQKGGLQIARKVAAGNAQVLSFVLALYKEREKGLKRNRVERGMSEADAKAEVDAMLVGDEDLLAEMRAELQLLFERADKSGRKEAWMLSALGQVYEAQGLYLKAIEQYRAYVPQFPKSGAQYSLARCYHEASKLEKDTDKAAELRQSAIDALKTYGYRHPENEAVKRTLRAWMEGR